jgi:hypothetical protein
MKKMYGFTVFLCRRCQEKVAFPKMDKAIAKHMFSLTDNLCMVCFQKERGTTDENELKNILHDISVRTVRRPVHV